ncbi:MAG: AI-2E family transporter [Eubacterium sp.]|nr:AI-2E family transporter [Eubacterium sp.]
MRNINRKKAAEYIVALLVIGAVLFVSINTAEAKKLFNYGITILTPFIYGFCIAYVLNLLVKQFDGMFNKHAIKKGKPVKATRNRVFAIIIAILIFVAFVALTVGMIIPNLKDTIVSFYKRAPELWQSLMDYLDGIKVKQPKLEGVITKLETEIDTYVSKITKWLTGNWSNILSSALSGIKSASNVAFNFAIGAVIAFGMLLYKEKLVKEVYMIMHKILPEKEYGYFCYVQELANKKFQIFLKYNVVQAVITGAGTFLFMLVTGIPYKISITLLVTVTQLVPIIGAIVGTAVSALLVAAESPIKAIIFVVLSILVQQLVEKLINPHLMGKELDMPGLLTFIVICLGGKQFGLVGLICAVPVVSVLYDIYTQKLRPKLKQQKE